jgi:hypothetical protein
LIFERLLFYVRGVKIILTVYFPSLICTSLLGKKNTINCIFFEKHGIIKVKVPKVSSLFVLLTSFMLCVLDKSPPVHEGLTNQH